MILVGEYSEADNFFTSSIIPLHHTEARYPQNVCIYGICHYPLTIRLFLDSSY